MIVGAYVARVVATGHGVGWIVFFAVFTFGLAAYSAARLRDTVTKEHMTSRLALGGIVPDDVGWCVVFDDARPRRGLRAYLVSEPGRLRVFDDDRPFDETQPLPELAPVLDASVERITTTPALFGVGRFVELKRPHDAPLRIYVRSATLAMLHAHFDSDASGGPTRHP